MPSSARRSRITFVILISSLVVTPASVTYYALSSSPSGVLVISALWLLAVLGRIVWLTPQAVWLRLRASAIPLQEQASAEIVTTILLVPAASAISGFVIVTATTFADQLDRIQAEAAVGYGWVAVEVAVISAALAIFAPFAALARIVRERGGTRMTLFDPNSMTTQLETAISTRWENLQGAKRLILRDDRVTALGGRTDEPKRAWPSNCDLDGHAAWRLVQAFPWVMVALFVAACGTMGLALADLGYAPELPDSLVVASATVLVASPTALAIWLELYVRLRREQSEANNIRRAQVLLMDRIVADATEGTTHSEQVSAVKARALLVRELFRKSPRAPGTPLCLGRLHAEVSCGADAQSHPTPSPSRSRS